jgi:hypothetical protein
MKSDIIDESSDNINKNSNIFQLKYSNHGDESGVGFKYSKYRDSNATENEINTNKKFKIQNNKKNTEYCGRILCKQTRLMIWKNYLVFSRNIKPTIFQIFTPIFICIILVFLQVLVNNFNSSFINKEPIQIHLENLHRCEYPSDCATIGYGIIVIIL